MASINFRDHLLRDPSAGNYYAPSHRNMSEVLFKTSPENGQSRIAKNGIPTSATIF
jgi:hypothetical protein